MLKDKSFRFAIEVIRLAERLRSEKREYVLSKQVLRTGTSPGACIREAEFAQSRKDFINKMSIALKEANETEYFLELLVKTNYLTKKEFRTIHHQCGEIKGMLIASVRTARSNLEAQHP